MKKLPSDSIRLLSSSQVITSPSSVVKELVENALDARATALDVKLEKSGLEKIEVRDNGCGIKQHDTEFMAQQYYTSKICKHEDLQMLETYGFRGEALSSLCQVADVSITTRTVEDPVALSYQLDHEGNVQSTKPTHDGVGTTVVASNIFKNFPVRKQCCQSSKRSKEELKKIEDILIAYGLINPQVRIILKNNRNLLWQKNKASDVKTALADVFGINVVSQFDYFEHHNNELSFTVKCMIPKNESDPQLMWRSSDDRSFIFVNKRYVVWKELLQILKKQCISLKRKETSGAKYPMCLVSVDLCSHDVDANLEPNKTKVIINHKEEVLELITNELCKIYKGSDLQLAAVCGSTTVESTTTPGLDNKTTDLNRNCELSAQETLEAAPNKSTSTVSSERTRDIELMGEDVALENSDSHFEGLNQPQNTDGNETCFSSTNIVDEAADETATIEENNVNSGNEVSQRDNCLTAKTDKSSVDSCGTSNSHWKEKRNENSESNSNVSAVMVEKQNDLNNNCDVDELLQDFMNDTDMLDDSLFDIAQTDEEQWSKGRGLVNENGKEVEPMELLRPSVYNEGNEKRTTSNGKRKNSFDQGPANSRSDRSSKKNKKYSMINGQSLLTSVLRSPKTSSSCKPTAKQTKEVPFSLSRLKTLAARQRASVTSKDDDIKLIKRLDPWGVWLVHKKRKLYILNPYRMQELLLYKRLLATHVVPREKLGKAIQLDETVLGNASRYSLLKKLVIKNNEDRSLRNCCDDERLVSNGFEITARLDRESGEFSMWLVKINTTIPYFGVNDLLEVLDLIKGYDSSCEEVGKTSHDLSSYRTSKVCIYLKDEVARISRSLPSRMTDTDIIELLKNMGEHLTESTNNCVHNRPLLYPLMPF